MSQSFEKDEQNTNLNTIQVSGKENVLVSKTMFQLTIFFAFSIAF